MKQVNEKQKIKNLYGGKTITFCIYVLEGKGMINGAIKRV